jgi:hypothetical protein
VRLVGFTIEIYCDARSYKRQIRKLHSALLSLRRAAVLYTSVFLNCVSQESSSSLRITNKPGSMPCANIHGRNMAVSTKFTIHLPIRGRIMIDTGSAVK